MATVDCIRVGWFIQGICLFVILYHVMVALKRQSHQLYFDTTQRIKEKGVWQRWLVKLHIRYIEQTQLKKYLPFITISRGMVMLLIFFIFCFVMVYLKSESIGLGMALSLVASFCPLIILDTLRQYNYQKTRGELIHFLSLLGQWYIVTDDIMKSFEKVSEQRLSEPLASYIDDFVVQVYSGLDTTTAFELLDRKVESDFFSTFVVNMDQALKNRGDVGIMLRNLEDEAYQLQEEFNRRKIGTVHDKIVIYCTMLLVLLIGYHFLVLNAVTENFYFHTLLGRGLVLVFCVLYVVGFFIALGLSKLEY
ncbi:MAG: type II secretion system F family protein [Clostridia bacterium]|nr:type II secretion system F family protein [Clostridia bacterium]